MVVTSGSTPTHFIGICLVGGPMLVFYGLKKLFLLRDIENTPTSKIRSAAVGKIELSGLAKMRKSLKSPLTQMDCCWWVCRVQEFRSEGKSSRWVTVHSVGQRDLFYLEDSTGKVMVNPMGAEVTVLNSTFDLNPANRTKYGLLLQSWGLSTETWLGFNKKMRILEESLPDCAPVYLLGEIAPVKNYQAERDSRFRARVRQLKSDPERMKQADKNQDSSVDNEEWDAILHEEETRFLKEELARKETAPIEESMMVRAPLDGPFLISTGTQSDVTRRYRWITPLSLLSGLTVSGGGVAWALAQDWLVPVIVGCIALGVFLSVILNRKGAQTWSSLRP